MEWPLYSPDLNPCDYYMWGYIKEKCCAKHPKTMEQLKGAIRVIIQSIKIKLKLIFFHFLKYNNTKIFCENFKLIQLIVLKIFYDNSILFYKQ